MLLSITPPYAFVFYGPTAPFPPSNVHAARYTEQILKDFINRYQMLKGRKVSYVPGWDCHGLPIELKVSQTGSLSVSRSDQPPGQISQPVLSVSQGDCVFSAAPVFKLFVQKMSVERLYRFFDNSRFVDRLMKICIKCQVCSIMKLSDRVGSTRPTSAQLGSGRVKPNRA